MIHIATVLAAKIKVALGTVTKFSSVFRYVLVYTSMLVPAYMATLFFTQYMVYAHPLAFSVFKNTVQTGTDESAKDAQQDEHMSNQDAKIDAINKERDQRRAETLAYRALDTAQLKEISERLSKDEGMAFGAFAIIGFLQAIGLVRKVPSASPHEGASDISQRQAEKEYYKELLARLRDDKPDELEEMKEEARKLRREIERRDRADRERDNPRERRREED